MARYRDSVCRLCRREGAKLFLKGDRCYSDKCAIERREYGPGQHGQGRRSKVSEFGLQLREKQKLRQVYGMLEKPFRNLFHKAANMKGVAGDNMLMLLETRLDSVIYTGGLTHSRAEARLLIGQNHFLVNGKRVNRASFYVKVGDQITLKEKSKKVTRFSQSLESSQRRGIPDWLELDRENMKITIKGLPTREHVTLPVNENLIIEYYSK